MARQPTGRPPGRPPKAFKFREVTANFTDAQIAALDRIAATRNASRNALLRELVDALIADDNAVDVLLPRIRVSRPPGRAGAGRAKR